MKNAVIYDRIAYKVKRKELKLRKKNLTKLTKDKGYQIKNIFIDNGYSGLNFERPNLKFLNKNTDTLKRPKRPDLFVFSLIVSYANFFQAFKLAQGYLRSSF